MSDHFPVLKNIFARTEEALNVFMGVLEPTIENAKDEHERLYFHHIYEEEEHRQDRLSVLNPKLDYFIEHNSAVDRSNHEFIRLLQDISLEKFGLHNFLEHLDLALFQFKDTEHETSLQSLRDMTHEDYQTIKSILNELNDQFEGAANSAASIPTDEKENVASHLKVDKYTDTPAAQSSSHSTTTVSASRQKKGLTVGSLKGGK
ncbi:IMEF encapsulin system ferritin-like cargo protein [Pseudalkalibacillus decolorationis]|uniref:IMEF encapsulin system ferritin-like cargo protein n=1 Tax=Pseudalkalibacillus decolorationis TaxID=163879 RepID=UPI002149413C|nr:IMEF encapsulin system ferritin-like cargo protein [Pseudalkalibacillus decolorationis]